MSETDNPRTDSAPEQTPETEFPLPPPSFDFLVMQLRMQAEMQLGLLHFGEEQDRPEPNLRLARHTIDTLAMLEKKTTGNLDFDEKRLLENTLTELRFRYVEATIKAKKS